MTAMEFLKARNRLTLKSARVTFFVIAATAILCPVATLALIFYQARLGKQISGTSLLWGIGMSMVVPITATCGTFWYRQRRFSSFIKAHPEMENIDKWAFLPTEKYPTNEAEKRALYPEVLAMLTEWATKSNDGIDFREGVREVIVQKNLVGYIYFTPGIDAVSDELNKSYLARWDLMVNTMGINPTRFSNPRRFRESLREHQ